MLSIKGLMNTGADRVETELEKKRIKLLNLIAIISLSHALIFFLFYLLFQNLDIQKSAALFFEAIFFSSIILLQGKGYFKSARYILIFSILVLLFYHCNYAFKGYYGEYQYIVLPLISSFLFDKKSIHYSLLFISILAFYVPNLFFHIYPDEYFGYLNVFFLFIGVFMIVDFFKRISDKNESALKEQLNENLEMHKSLDKANKELNTLNEFQNNFLVNVAHEIATPLTLIKGNIGHLQINEQTAETKEIFKKLKNQISKIDFLMKDIVDLAKAQGSLISLEKNKVSVNQLLQKSFFEFEPIFKQKKLKLNVITLENDCLIDIDERYFERVLANILMNALKYTSEWGKTTISAKRQMNTVVVSISDDGIGVPKSDLNKIFERFYQSKNEINSSSGSGIGLAFAKEIIELHDGSINAGQSESGGLQINISMQSYENSESYLIPDGKEEEKKFNLDYFFGEKVLVVDDNKEMREYLVSVLSNFNVLTAENGQDALKKIEKHKISALITDSMMPVMDGKALVTKLKEMKSSIPIIVITARADTANKLEMLSLGVDDYLNKPFIEEELLLRLRNILTNNKVRSNVKTNENETKLTTEEINYTVTKCIELVNKNISDPYYGVAQISYDLDISERTLYRILKKETGLSPNIFIRELKLSKVRRKIEHENNMTLNDLALSVGLKNGSYLNKLYEERYGRPILRK